MSVKKSREAGSFSDQNRGDLYPLLCLILIFLNIIALVSIFLCGSRVKTICRPYNPHSLFDKPLILKYYVSTPRGGAIGSSQGS